MNSETLEFEVKRLIEESVASSHEMERMSIQIKELEDNLARAKFALAESQKVVRELI